jgi:beta-phosphoglucomutase family hydrolase
MGAPIELPIKELEAVLFDMDGVVTDTSSTHAAAWKEVFDDVLRTRSERNGEAFVPFRSADYLAFVDGKPREEGIRSFLTARGIELPEGGSSDRGDLGTVHGIAERKNDRFRELLGSGAVEVFASTMALVEELRKTGVRIGLFTSSRNMDTVLDAAGVMEAFDVRVGGVEAASRGLRGKPEPDILLETASQLGVSPGHAAVIEDARSGVLAARRGGFRLVIGVDRGGNAAALREAGADAVVADLAAVRLETGGRS